MSRPTPGPWKGADGGGGGKGGVAPPPPTPGPWKVQRAGESIWIAGPQVSGDTVLAAKDRRIVCEFRLFGDDALDAETEANFALIVERVNGAER
jgi:hypothetical protein